MGVAFPLEGMTVQFSGQTDVGRKRKHNEDSIHLPDKLRLAVVADGMGGHASGEVASEMAVTHVRDYFYKTADEQVLTWPYKVDRDDHAEINRMTQAVMLANIEIFDLSRRDKSKKGMGTTIVAAYFLDDTIVIGHVGDSRVYRIRGGKITQLTEDHSLVNEYIKMKRVTVEEAESWPHKNVIVRALGMKASVQVDIIKEQPQPGDYYVMCSDGLCGMLTDEQISTIASASADIDTAARQLIYAANEEGGTDNISVIVAHVSAA